MFDDEQIDAINAEAGRRAADKRRRIELEAACVLLPPSPLPPLCRRDIV